VPAPAVAAAAKVTFCGTPTASVIAAGVAVTPVGNPLIVIWIVPEKPLSAVAVSVTDCVAPPGVKLTLVALVVSVKSGLPTSDVCVPQPMAAATRKDEASENTEICQSRRIVRTSFQTDARR